MYQIGIFVFLNYTLPGYICQGKKEDLHGNCFENGKSHKTLSGKINSLLVKSGVEVRELSMQHGGFEDYFIGRIGR